jgi:DNA-binding GntR family transcriptional regulator
MEILAPARGHPLDKLSIIDYRYEVKSGRPVGALKGSQKRVSPRSSASERPEDAVESRPASAVVADALRAAILHGKFPDGERVRQDAVAARFGVSQTIVREAFKQLVAEGFLTAEPRRGVSVASLSADEAWEMTQLRGLIEAQALAWAIPSMTGADFDEAAHVLRELDRAKSTDRIITLNARFHELLYVAARRDRTTAIITALRLNFERYLRLTWEATPHRDQSQREHWQLLELCRARDVAAASDLLRRHIVATGDLLVERLRARSSPT